MPATSFYNQSAKVAINLEITNEAYVLKYPTEDNEITIN